MAEQLRRRRRRRRFTVAATGVALLIAAAAGAAQPWDDTSSTPEPTSTPTVQSTPPSTTTSTPQPPPSATPATSTATATIAPTEEPTSTPSVTAVPTSTPSPSPSPSPTPPTYEIGGPCELGFILWDLTRPGEEEPGRHVVTLWTNCDEALGSGLVPEEPPPWWPGPVPIEEIEETLGRTIEEHIALIYEGWEPYIPVP